MADGDRIDCWVSPPWADRLLDIQIAKETGEKMPGTSMVHRTAADLLFQGGVEMDLRAISKVAKEKPRTFQTPEYRSEFADELLARIEKYVTAMPAVGEEAGVELHWEPPEVIFDEIADAYVMVKRDENET